MKTLLSLGCLRTKCSRVHFSLLDNFPFWQVRRGPNKKPRKPGACRRHEPSWLVCSVWLFQNYPVFIPGILHILGQEEKNVKLFPERDSELLYYSRVAP